MKETALITCYFQRNYGSMLQAYATQRYLNSVGIQNKTICVSGFANEIKKAKRRYFASRMFSPDVIKDKWGYVKLYVKRKTNKTINENIKKREKAFDDFANRFFDLSGPYNSLSDLGKRAEEYSAFVVGSDQLWLPSNIAAGYYTLEFINESAKVKRIAYATSFGVSELSRRQAEAAKRFLRRFDALSVREQSGKELIKELINKDVQITVDPTMLLTAEEWRSVLPRKRAIERPYIFCYFLGTSALPRQAAVRLKSDKGLPVTALLHLDAYIKTDERIADFAPYDVSPFDFPELIDNAQYVCTDSFHAVVFSILFGKTFFAFNRFDSKSSMSTNGRIISLLGMLKLGSRLVRNMEEFTRIVNTSIDYKAVSEELCRFREASSAFLTENLRGSETDGIAQSK